MSFRYRDDDSLAPSVVSLAVGALAGFVAGVLLAQRVGGVEGISERFRRRRDQLSSSVRRHFEEEEEQFEDELEDEVEEAQAELEDRVLEAFRNDPILGERAVDIGAVGEGVIELTGWVRTEDEADHAVTVARGTPGVDTVVNRLMIGEEEELLDDNVRRVEEGDAALTEAHWEGQNIGTGRRRQGSSDEPDRHADPRVELEDRWLSEQEALRNAADDTEGLAERRRAAKKKSGKGDRTGGSPVAPTGVPKADHVRDPESGEVTEGRAD
jgi:hypothetical protein